MYRCEKGKDAVRSVYEGKCDDCEEKGKCRVYKLLYYSDEELGVEQGKNTDDMVDWWKWE